MSAIFDILSNLPIFSGVSTDTLARTVGKFRIDFRKYKPGDIIIAAGEPCHELIFTISGNADVTYNLSGGRSIRRSIEPNSVIFPEYLLGRSVSAPATVVAVDQVSAMAIRKTDLLELIEFDYIYKLNFLNMLCSKAQHSLAVADDIDSGRLCTSESIIDDLIL